jgi:uncharacterized protein (DUF952 family)
MMLTLHGTPADLWQAASNASDYAPEAYDSDGFVHTSIGAAALAAALNRYLRGDQRKYVALLIDLDRVTVPWEIAHYSGDAARYPHLHGRLDRDAVVAVVDVPRTADGGFLPPIIA